MFPCLVPAVHPSSARLSSNVPCHAYGSRPPSYPSAEWQEPRERRGGRSSAFRRPGRRQRSQQRGSRPHSRWQEPLQIFIDRLRGKGLRGERACFEAASLLQLLRRNKQWSMSLEVLGMLDEAGVEYDEKCCSQAISACGGSSQWTQAVQLLADFNYPTAAVCSAAIAACGRAGQWARALEIFALNPDNSWNKFALSAVISACAQSAQWMPALSLLENADSFSNPEDLTMSYNAAITACDKAGHWHLALSLLREMDAWAVPPSIVSYNAVISACAGGADMTIPLELFEELQRRKMEPDAITGSSLLHAVEKDTSTGSASRVLDLLQGCGIEPSLTMYDPALTACQKETLWEAALVLFNQMTSSNMSLDTVVYSRVLAAQENAGGSPRHAAALLEDFRGFCRDVTMGKVKLPFASRGSPLFDGADVLTERDSLDYLTAQHYKRLFYSPVLTPLLACSAADGSAPEAIASEGLNDRLLARQPGLGEAFTQQALLDLGLAAAGGHSEWMGSARRTSRRETQELAPDGVLSSPSILAWLGAVLAVGALELAGRSGYNTRTSASSASPLPVTLQQRGQLASYAEPVDWWIESLLQPVFREHDRSMHAERLGMLRLLGVLQSTRQSPALWTQ